MTISADDDRASPGITDTPSETDAERSVTENKSTPDADSLEWIVAEDERVNDVSDLDVKWAGSPLVRSGHYAYPGAVLLVGLAVALATDSLAGHSTGPNLIELAPTEIGLILTTATVPLSWLGAVPVALGSVGVAVGLLPVLRSIRTEYVLTSEVLYVRTRRVRDDRFTRLGLERVVDTARHQSLVGRLLSYGTITFRTVETDIPKVDCIGIANPREVHSIVLALDASDDSPLDRTQEYVRVVPSTGRRSSSEIVNQIQPLHNLDPTDESGWQRLIPFAGPDPLTFEFSIYSNGTEAPIEFYYTADQHLSTLSDRLKSVYPETVEIERVTVDLAEKLVAPVEYSYEEFETALENGTLQTSVEEVKAITRVHGDQALAADGGITIDSAESEADTPLGRHLPTADPDALRARGDEENGDPGSRMFELETPVDTGEGVLARPHPDEVEPYGLRWTGSGDPMTPIRRFNEEGGDEDVTTESSHAPLTVLIDHFATTDHPIVFQAAFEGEPDATRRGNQRVERIKGDRESWGDVIIQEIENLIYGPEPEQERRRRESQPIPEADRDFIGQLKIEDWGHRFTVNLRAVTVPPNSVSSDTSELKQSLRNISTVFDPLEGEFYSIESENLYDKGLVARRSRTFSRRCFNRLLDREIVTGKRLGRSTPDLHLDPNELCNMIIVPSTEHLTDEATKETHATPESRTSLPGLEAAQRRQYTTGMVLGQDPTSSVDGPLRLPPDPQTRHWLICATTGAGKSQLVNRMLRSLAETTPGPNILFEPKGDGMCVNYLMGHYKKYGTLEDVYYFREPEMLPAVSFFDLRPALEAGHDRETAVKEKADHFHALMRMIMGADRHEQAFVANEVLTFLIHALFDPVHGDDVFGFDDLVKAATRMQRNRELPDVSEINGDIHDSLDNQFNKEDHQFHTTMGAVLNRLNRLKEDRHLHWMLRHKPGREAEGDSLYGFHNQDVHFDFRDLLDKDVTVLFDIGDLTLDAQRGLTTILLSNLWHAIQHRRRDSVDNVVNVILEEAAPFVATELVADQLLPKGRSSGVSLGLVMQYPEQVQSWDTDNNGAYDELLTEVHTKLVGDISITDRFAKTFTHDEMTVEDVRNRNNRMASGEWFTKLASPQFGEDRPAPLTLHSLPIISGHPESDEPLTDAEQATFDEELLPELIERTDDEYGLDVPTQEDAMEWSEWDGTDRARGSSPEPGPGEGEPEVDVGSKAERAEGKRRDGSVGESVEHPPSHDSGPAPDTKEEAGSAPVNDSAEDDGEDGVGDEGEGCEESEERVETTDNSVEPADEEDGVGAGEPADIETGTHFFDSHGGSNECPVTDTELRKRGLSRDDAIFLKRVLDAMNRELPGYTLLEGMGELKEGLDGLDVTVLIDQELIEKETVNRRVYYTVLPEGRELLDETLTADAGTGDLGEKTPHKVGVELLYRWVQTLEEVERVARYYHQDSETVFDVVGFDTDGDLIWVGEVEMASHNAEAVVDDYNKMGAADANAVWAFPSRAEAENTIEVLADADCLPSRVSGRTAHVFSRMQEAVEDFEADGMTTIHTFRKMNEEVEK